MAVVMREGFEFGDQLGLAATNLAINSVSPLDGTYNIYGSQAQDCSYTLPSDLSDGYFGIRFKFAATPGLTQFVRFRYNSTNLVSVQFNPFTMRIEVCVSGTVVDSGAIVLAAGQTYYLDVHAKIDDTTGVIAVRIDGVDDASFTGDTKPGADTAYNNIQLVCGSSPADPARWDFDDLKVNDTTGGADDSWCGDARIMALTVDADGDVIQLTPSAGSNYQCVDERPPDNDTTYCEESTADKYDLYNLTACGLTGVTIKRVWGEARARDTIGTPANCQIGLKTGGTEYWSSDLPLLTTYRQIKGDNHVLNPKTGVDWTTADLDALQVGFKVR